MTVLIANRFTAGISSNSSRFLGRSTNGGLQRLLLSRCLMQQKPRTTIIAAAASFSNSSSSSNTTTTTALDEEEETTTTDVLIVGGGVVGCALARQLTTLLPGIRVDLVEAGKGHYHTADAAASVSMEDPIIPHARSYALSPASLETLGWKDNPPTTSNNKSRIGYYDSMQIWEANQPSFLLFTSHDLAATAECSYNINKQQLQQQPPISYLGACVEDRYIVQHLWKEIQEKCRCIHTESTVSHVQVPQHSSHGLVKVQLLQQSSSPSSSSSSGQVAATESTRTREIHTHLLVAADGGNSSIRRMLNIPMSASLPGKEGHGRFDYGQVALTFTVELEESHNGRAFQRFLAPSAAAAAGSNSSSGGGGGGAEPLALLPTFSDKHATIVWSTSPENVQEWKGNPRLLHHVNELLQQGPQLFENNSSNPSFFGRRYDQHPKNENGGDSIFSNLQYGAEKFMEALQYGPALMAAQEANLPFTAPPRLVTEPSVQPLQFTFPLSTGHVSTYGDANCRFALIGDAAHTMHPMAGQGLNLGLQDVADLCQSIQKATDAGMDVNTFISSHYNVNRKFQVALTLSGIHALHSMYGMQHVAAKHVKSLGMNMIQNVALLRRQLAQAACHGVAVPM